MSDVHNAPAPAAPSTPAPATPPAAPAPVDVPVNQSPVTQQAPIGSQAPPKPEGQESNKGSQISRREALQNAFARSKQAQDEAAKRPATPRPRETAEKPDGKPQADARPQQHREQGRFARDPSKPPQDQPPGQQQPGQQAQQQRPQPLDPAARFRDPPQRFSDQAKAEWAGAPESVRGAVHQMAREFQGAYEKYRGDHEVMETVRPYHELAVKQGTTLEKAFTNYYKMEQKLREDVVGGLDVIVRNLRIQGANGEPITLRDVAHHIMTMTPEQHRLTQHQNQQTAADMRIGQLSEVVEKLTQNVGQLHYQQRFRDTRAEVDAFAQTHPRLDELGAAIKQELDLGFTLPVAYARADRLYPATQAAQTRNTSAQTRRTSISGAPDGGSNTPNTRPSDGRRSGNGEDKHPTRREALAKAMRRVSNGI